MQEGKMGSAFTFSIQPSTLILYALFLFCYLYSCGFGFDPALGDCAGGETEPAKGGRACPAAVRDFCFEPASGADWLFLEY